ncbi:MAG TPA: ferric reductase-like transmembrane domain-containing protein [Vicinamibacterales bacterium]|jgi:predicted ferric reductase
MTAIDLSSDIGLVAVGCLTANLLFGLLLSVGYNPARQWPRRPFKLFTFHNWTGYTALALSTLHPIVLLFSATAGFGVRDIAIPLWSPTQPVENTIGAVGFYLVAFVVLTSLFRTVFGHRNWKRLHYTVYAAATAFFIHSLLTDPLLKNRPVDWLDAEKVFVEGCMLAVAAATVWRIRYGRQRSADRLARQRLALGGV